LFFLFLGVLTILLFLVLSIAFITLFERHLLGLSQVRLGPNKVFFFGVGQAILDGIKLFKKEQVLLIKFSVVYFLFVPGVSFFVLFLEIFCLPFFFFFLIFNFLFYFCCVWLEFLFILLL
jgi:NADH:ubiquinone oxidoreductase subunit H